MQSQEFAEAKWSISERTGGLTEAEVDAAFDRGEILRTHVLRPTWHFVTPADIRWMLQPHGAARARGQPLALPRPRPRRGGAGAQPRGARPRARRRRAAHAAGARRGARRAGIDTEGQRLAHTMMHAELERLVVSGPRRGKQHTYLLLDDRVPHAADRTPDGSPGRARPALLLQPRPGHREGLLLVVGPQGGRRAGRGRGGRRSARDRRTWMAPRGTRRAGRSRRATPAGRS